MCELVKRIFLLRKKEKAESQKLVFLLNENDKFLRENIKLRYEIRFLETKKSVIRNETIKEFAKRFEYFVLHEDPEINDLKCKDYESYMGGVNQFRLQIVKGIDNLVKEMTEVKEN